MRVKDKKAIVISYGQGRKIEKISINLFEDDYFYDIDLNDSRIETASTYCKSINNIELKDDSWIYARIVTSNNPYLLSNFIPFKFSEIIIKLDDIAVQKILREIVDKNIILNAIKIENENIRLKILMNMSKDESERLKEKINNKIWMDVTDVKDAQEEILLVIHHLIESGDIISPYASEEELIKSI